jgi:hypothetical protein
LLCDFRGAVSKDVLEFTVESESFERGIPDEVAYVGEINNQVGVDALILKLFSHACKQHLDYLSLCLVGPLHI